MPAHPCIEVFKSLPYQRDSDLKGYGCVGFQKIPHFIFWKFAYGFLSSPDNVSMTLRVLPLEFRDRRTQYDTELKLF